jgi:hypothetical protein
MNTTVENKKKVETIFDHNPTADELTMIGLHSWFDDYEERVARRKKILEEADEPDYFKIGLLFDRRGDTKRAEEYLAKAHPWQLEILNSFLYTQQCGEVGSVNGL